MLHHLLQLKCLLYGSFTLIYMLSLILLFSFLKAQNAYQKYSSTYIVVARENKDFLAIICMFYTVVNYNKHKKDNRENTQSYGYIWLHTLHMVADRQTVFIYGTTLRGICNTIMNSARFSQNTHII